MLGAIAGDVIGSVHEFSGCKEIDFPLLSPGSSFTDDTVLTVAVATAILDQRDYGRVLREFGRSHPGRGYGLMFGNWLRDESLGPYQSRGNDSAMRVSPVGWAFDSIEQGLEEAKRSAEVTHDHPEGVRGAQAVALVVVLAKRGADKTEIKREVVARTLYPLDKSVAELRPTFNFSESGSPQAAVSG